MKKVITALFVAAAVSVHAFALEFILTPTIGYSNLSFAGVSEPVRIGNSYIKADVSSNLNVMSIGVALGTIAQNGFTFMWNNNIAPVGNGYGEGKLSELSFEVELEAKLKRGIAFEQSFIFGRTFKAVDDKLYINVGSGLAWGVAKINMSKKVAGVTTYSKDIYDFNIGVPLQLGMQYFFTNNIGLNLTVSDVLAFGIGWGHKIPGAQGQFADGLLGQYGFENVFTAKIGPVFKF